MGSKFWALFEVQVVEKPSMFSLRQPGWDFWVYEINCERELEAFLG